MSSSSRKNASSPALRTAGEGNQERVPDEQGAPDELERIRDILVGSVARSADERFAALEQRLEAALADMRAKVDADIATLRHADTTKVSREQLANLFAEAGRALENGKASTARLDSLKIDKAA